MCCTAYFAWSFASNSICFPRIASISNWSFESKKLFMAVLMPMILLILLALKLMIELNFPIFFPIGSKMWSNPKHPGSWHPLWPLSWLFSVCWLSTLTMNARQTDKTNWFKYNFYIIIKSLFPLNLHKASSWVNRSVLENH